jgi:hypothetical protein
MKIGKKINFFAWWDLHELISSLGIPACFRIARRVPFFKSLLPCSGTDTVFVGG